MKTERRIIDLARYCDTGSLVISGRPKGELLRDKLQLDQEDERPDAVEVIIPTHIISLNSSFFLGLFAPSVQKLGIEKFDAKYKFQANAEIREDIEEGKREALEESNPLPVLNP
jgi:hypothetical protein